MVAIYPISWTVSRLTIAVLFFGLITPVGLLFRLLGRNTLALDLEPKAETYWVSREIPNDLRRYLQQY
jgi:hypothetical protein